MRGGFAFAAPCPAPGATIAGAAPRPATFGFGARPGFCPRAAFFAARIPTRYRCSAANETSIPWLASQSRSSAKDQFFSTKAAMSSPRIWRTAARTLPASSLAGAFSRLARASAIRALEIFMPRNYKKMASHAILFPSPYVLVDGGALSERIGCAAPLRRDLSDNCPVRRRLESET